MTNNEMLSIAEVARRMKITYRMITKLIETKQIVPFEPYPGAKRNKVLASEIERYYETRRGEQ